jgi:hypothetical protein
MSVECSSSPLLRLLPIGALRELNKLDYCDADWIGSELGMSRCLVMKMQTCGCAALI